MAENQNRWKIQLGGALASNPFLLNFLHGKIARGSLKTVCAPGLNCYSCPAAAASCPIGALQAVIGASKFQFAYYVVGFLLLVGALLGRLVCGFLCPFGWFQELLHKLPTRKFSTKRLHVLTFLKYGVLLLFVIVLPMTVVNEVGMGDPFFCKYLCPAGILEGGLPLAMANASIRASLGRLFTWKSCILLGVIVLSVFFTDRFASGCVLWGHSMDCATESQSIICMWIRIAARPVARAAGYAKWMWTCFARPIMLSASAAETVPQPAHMERLRKPGPYVQQAKIRS